MLKLFPFKLQPWTSMDAFVCFYQDYQLSSPSFKFITPGSFIVDPHPCKIYFESSFVLFIRFAVSVKVMLVFIILPPPFMLHWSPQNVGLMFVPDWVVDWSTWHPDSISSELNWIRMFLRLGTKNPLFNWNFWYVSLVTWEIRAPPVISTNNLFEIRTKF